MNGLWFSERVAGWGRVDRFVKVDQPLFWLAVTLMVCGALFVQAVVAPALWPDPGPVSLMLFAWTLYCVPLVALIVWLDLHEPEPPWLLAAAFGWGALVAVPLARVANEAVGAVLYKRLDDAVVERWYASWTGPWTEETLKALGFVVVLGLARRQLNTLLDGLVYGAFIGLGFQVAENVITTANSLNGLYATGAGQTVLNHLLVRGLGLGLWSHAVYTAIVGVGVAFAVLHPGRRSTRVLALVASLVVAGALHFVWNAPWWQPDLNDPVDTATTYLAMGSPAFLLVAALGVLAVAREVEWFAPALDGQPEVTPEETAALRTWHGRRAARAAARAVGGRRGRLAARRLQGAQVRLAVALATDRTEADVEAARRLVREARADLDAACGPR